MSVIKTSELNLYREIIAVFGIHTTHINTHCGHNEEFLNIKLAIYIANIES
jgi:hypothetical protein